VKAVAKAEAAGEENTGAEAEAREIAKMKK